MYSLISSIEFNEVRETIKAKQKKLKKDGKGNLPRTAEAATDEEIKILWESGQFGSHSPEAIINTMWFYNTVHFGLRGNTEHRNMGDVSLCTDSSGREYLEFSERQTKTRTGENPRDTRKVKPKMWDVPVNPRRCPVAIFKKYLSVRPVCYSNSDDPYYIATHSRGLPRPGEQWFPHQPIGINKIGSLMKNMATAANLPPNKRLTNHSARKHLIQKLSDQNIPPTQIMQISGHRNIQSVNAYSTISENQHRETSGILNNQSSHP
uniref:Zinc finger MYM-type protein 4-like n=1 Tax=Saccoglossus kowalevskii TaxID=10224 RepID=A0ABM0LVP4_SACKO|nr:PREDICTED: zinc finger MYM-type protein 4-like [Saccoglossus kowalevskii]